MPEQTKYIRPDKCQNCDYPLDKHDHYCPQCGQKALPEHLTLKYFIREFLNTYFSFDSKFFNTLTPLLFKPSYLSIEFFQGRRISYINPIQLFIFSSFLYFLINSFMFLKEGDGENDLVKINKNNQPVHGLDSIKIEKQDSLYILKDDVGSDTIDNAYVGEFIQKSQDFNNLDKEERNERMSKTISYSVFFLMPLFALYLGWFYSQKRRKYLENLIFSLHFHAFYFVSGAFFLMTDRILPGQMDILLHHVLVLVYLLVALRRFFEFSWFATIFRLLGLVFLYGMTVSVALVSSILISIFI